MDKFDLVLSGVERAEYALRSLYLKYGFSQYKMSKFEEYDLYAQNKDFLVSENVITFNDTDGKLLALKPDVTLSIIKNGKDDLLGVQKVFYNENVYRVSKGTQSFKELMQVGLECIGDIDEYEIVEVLSLAVKSLKTLSGEFVLDISHLELVNALLEKSGLSENGKAKVFSYLSEKNAQAVKMVCESENVQKEFADYLNTLVTVYGKPSKVLSALEKIKVSGVTECVEQLKRIISALSSLNVDQNVNIDFSVVSDTNYYNGIVFKGFLSGIPTSILSGGQYDKLMKKMKKKSKAIGFAVYLDELETIYETDKNYDVDLAIEYANGVDALKLNKFVEEQIKSGLSVITGKNISDKIRYAKLIKFDGEDK